MKKSEQVDPNVLLEVAYQNRRDNQIGGVNDGITPEVAADLGYTLPEDVADLVSDTGQLATKAADLLEKDRQTAPQAGMLNPNLPGRELPSERVVRALPLKRNREMVVKVRQVNNQDRGK